MGQRISILLRLSFLFLGLIMKNNAQFSLMSRSFAHQEPIHLRYTCDGTNTIPDLSWKDAPAGTQSFALIMQDPDAPRSTPFIHWLVAHIPGNATSVSGNYIEGLNDFGKKGYGGPCPPAGKAHRYFFELYALDAIVPLEQEFTVHQLQDALRNHILAKAELMGIYKRKE